ncbi:MAG: peptidylprolyl isomerase [Clostridium sp.]|nr:peptidylprolyl isomerase [Prevotella sp.]MCM1428652.1 peptidylprolyl isomerase [Clostridium sp.]MCM1475781.1 peptidylprolyl isomerase [Muribaculaceae bacterium]
MERISFDIRLFRRLASSATPVALMCSSLLAGCSHSADDSVVESSDVLLSLGDSTLFLQDVTAKIPHGLSAEDSTELFDNIVRNWLESQLFSSLGEENLPDMERIDRLTEDYRNRLIAESYRQNVRRAASRDVSEETVRQYYDSHAEEMTLQAPILKGFFVKVKADAPNLDRIRACVENASPKDIDRLESFAGSDNVQFAFFGDKWVDWAQVAYRIPYHFENPEAFLSVNKFFETSSGEYLYLMHISSYLKSGERMPFDYAYPIIAENLSSQSEADYERSLYASLLRKAQRDGRLKLSGYSKLPI